MKRVSIYEVAEKADVSISTVSRVLNNSAGVKPNKVDAVRKAMKELNYVPSELARGLAKNATKMIGFYMPFSSISLFDSKYALELLRGVDKVISRTDYSMVILNENVSDFKKLRQPKFVSYVMQNRIDGLILNGIYQSYESFPYFKKLLDNNFPVAYIGKRVNKEGFNVYAGYDNYIYSMLEAFYKNGHRKVLAVINKGSFNLDRFEQVIKKFRKEHSEYLDITIIETNANDNNEQLINSLKDLILIKKCTGIFCDITSNIPLILSFLYLNNLSVPNDVSVIGIEHHKDDCAAYYPPINSFYVPAYEMGSIAAEMLISSLRGEIVEETSKFVHANYINRGSMKNVN
ncbi:LacI family DNA-binding transcriptional regulator [Clostridium beijerinckii]|uniref:LacI family DNA-binding transcriptional regulator n=1 Tax=Clostridium beijerinckii TaxID=1520 RepID=UPI002FFB480F